VSGQSIRAVNMRQLESVHIPQYLAIPIITHYVRKAAEGAGFVFEVENLPRFMHATHNIYRHHTIACRISPIFGFRMAYIGL